MDSRNEKHYLAYRPDIDGLRAIAVLLVIIFHAFPKFLKGGFVGVDIFFVISGYLITGIIVKGLNQNNFSLFEFYSRRIKRIFPALITVLAFCLIVGWFILLADEYEALGKHITGGSVYLSNIILQSESGYFDTKTELKPLLHLWSLSIEEQFYLCFPLLLVVAYRFGLNILGTIGVCLWLSFLLNILKITSHPTEVFFFPYTRAWELLIGGLIAANQFHANDSSVKTSEAAPASITFINENKSNLIAWLGLILILLGWFFFDSRKILYPSWWALVPTLGAVCLIAAGENSWFNRRILAHKYTVYVGLISYPLYLWHWVLLSFLRITEIDAKNTWLLIAALMLSFILAIITYHFIEKQIRFRKHRFVSIGLLTGLFLLGYLGYNVYQHKGYPHRFTNDRSWVEGDIGNEKYRENGWIAQKNCVAKYAKVPFEQFPDDQFCLIQAIDKPATALLVGDSHANHLYSGLIHQEKLTGGNLINLGGAACLPIYDNSKHPNKRCPQLINEILDAAIALPSIKTIFLANRAITILNEKSFKPKRKLFELIGLSVNKNEIDPYRIFENGLRKTLNRFSKVDKQIIYILDTPELEFDPIICKSRPWRLGDANAKTPCGVALAHVRMLQNKYLTIVNTVLSDFPKVKVWNPLPIMCDTSYCWAIKDDKMLYRDDNHLNEQGAIYLSKHFPVF